MAIDLTECMDLGGRRGDELDDLITKADNAARELAAVAVTKTNSDGSVSVTVGAVGNLLDVRLRPRALSMGPDRLGEVLMKLVGQACQEAADKMQAAFKDVARAGSAPLLSLESLLPGNAND
jgi:DNA-binding protein YbaB